MSTSLLYHGFAVRGYRHKRTECVGAKVMVWTEQETADLACPVCGSAAVVRNGCQERRFHMVPIGQHLGVGWDTVKDTQSCYLTRRFARPKLRRLRQLAIGEIAVGRRARASRAVSRARGRRGSLRGGRRAGSRAL
jgi:hypothetical protein